jgi:hypothetical protein
VCVTGYTRKKKEKHKKENKEKKKLFFSLLANPLCLYKIYHFVEVKDHGVWKALWSLEVPNQVKMFMWRAFQNLLPTRANLYKRKIVKDGNCPCCGQEEENVIHVLWTCPAAQDVWGGGGVVG